MHIIFLTMSTLTEEDTHGIYSDLMRKFRDEGHEVYIVSPRERRTGEKTRLYEAGGVHILGVRTLNLQKTNVIEKGIGQVLVESQFKKAIKKHLGDVKADLILYSTPPITVLYRFFRKKEKKLYALSDYIGCMSPANVRYVIEHNQEVKSGKVEVAPNSYERVEQAVLTEDERCAIREKHQLPTDKPVFVYGGNLGKPQGIPFL